MRFKHVLRRLAGSPLFTIVTVLTLAIGMGANTAIFSVIEGILLKPLPYAQPDRLIAVDHVAPAVTSHNIGASPFLYFTYREQSRTLEDVAMWKNDAVSITGVAEPERVDAEDFTDGVLPVLGVQPALGRQFTREDMIPANPRTAMLSYGYWQSKFGGDPNIVGKTIQADGNSYVIIAVLPRDFWFMDRKPALILPLRFDRGKVYLGNFSYEAFARLKPGVTLAQASADAARLIPLALHNFPPYPGYDVKMFEQSRLAPHFQPLKQNFLGDIGGVLWVLMGTIGMVLLIACANVANLLLVRAEGRQQELAIRAALGADRGQIARDLLAESLTLGILGGACGLAVAYAGLRLLVSIAPADLPRISAISIDGPVLLFTLAISLAGGLLFGAIPTFKYAGVHLATTLRAGGRTSSQSRERHRTRNTLVVVQVALALVLLISSGLMIRTFYALKQVDPGFVQPETLQTLRISIPETQVKDELQTMHMVQAIIEKAAALPGVQSAGVTSVLPMTGSGWQDPIYCADKDYSDNKLPPLRRFKFFTPGVMATMGNRLIAGREITWADTYDKRPVAMVSESMARELWGSPTSALGKRIRESNAAPWREVIGVINDERDDGVNQAAPPAAVFPVLMDNFAGNEKFVMRGLSLTIRTGRAGAKSFLDELRQAIWSVNPNLPLAAVHTMQEIEATSMARTSFTLVMLAIAGAMALLLGVIGIYGVISYSVSQRTREIGIRMALGASMKKLTAMFVLHGLRLSAIGVACGLAGALAVTRVMRDLLFEVRPTDPVTYIAVSLGLVLAAMLASYLPALRATAVDPVEALRAE